MFGLAVGNFIDRIVIVHAEPVTDGHALGLQRAEDGVVDERASQRADVGSARRGLRVVDRLRDRSKRPLIYRTKT